MDTADEQCGDAGALASGQVDFSGIDFGEHARTTDPADVARLVQLVDDVGKIKAAKCAGLPADGRHNWDQLEAHLLTHEIPNHMWLQMGLLRFTHENAWTVSLKLRPEVDVPKWARSQLLDWLEENGLAADNSASLNRIVCKLIRQGENVPYFLSVRHTYVARIKLAQA